VNGSIGREKVVAAQKSEIVLLGGSWWLIAEGCDRDHYRKSSQPSWERAFIYPSWPEDSMMTQRADFLDSWRLQVFPAVLRNTRLSSQWRGGRGGGCCSDAILQPGRISGGNDDTWNWG